jgi:hypothetical protein
MSDNWTLRLHGACSVIVWCAVVNALVLVFTALGTATLVAPEVPLGWLRSTVVLPLVVVAAGVVLLVSSVRRGRSHDAPSPQAPGVEDAAVEPEQAPGADRR